MVWFSVSDLLILIISIYFFKICTQLGKLITQWFCNFGILSYLTVSRLFVYDYCVKALTEFALLRPSLRTRPFSCWTRPLGSPKADVVENSIHERSARSARSAATCCNISDTANACDFLALRSLRLRRRNSRSSGPFLSTSIVLTPVRTFHEASWSFSSQVKAVLWSLDIRAMASHIRVLEKLLNDLRAWVSAAVEQIQDLNLKDRKLLCSKSFWRFFFATRRNLPLPRIRIQAARRLILWKACGLGTHRIAESKASYSEIQSSPCALISLICICA